MTISNLPATILAACSLLCAIASAVCLGFLVIGGDDGTTDTAAGSVATSSTDGAGESGDAAVSGDAGVTSSADSTDSDNSAGSVGSTVSTGEDAGSNLPDGFTGRGWVSTDYTCLDGDQWVYAAEGPPGKMILCLHGTLLYPGGDVSSTADLEQFKGVNVVCPIVDDNPVGHFTISRADTGWIELQGTTRYVMDIFSGRGEMSLNDPDNLTEEQYDAFWTNTEVSLPGMSQCSGFTQSPTQRLLENYG